MLVGSGGQTCASRAFRHRRRRGWGTFTKRSGLSDGFCVPAAGFVDVSLVFQMERIGEEEGEGGISGKEEVADGGASRKQEICETFNSLSA